jgi:hypothetical protein
MSAAWPDEISRLEQLVDHYKEYGAPASGDDSIAFIKTRREALRLMLEAYDAALSEIEEIKRTTSATSA